MSEKKKLVPKRRFKEFENADPWEQRKFSDYYEMVSGFAFKLEDYCLNGVGLINGESIQHGYIEDANMNKLPFEFLNHYSNFILREGDIVVGLNRPITNGKLKIAKILCEHNDSLLYQRAGKIKYKNENNADFTYILLSQEILKHTLKEAVGSDQPFVSTSKLNKWEMLIPTNIMEQNKIGSFMASLDNLITLHQRKLEKLKNLKSAYLSEMFPAEGERKPKRRFAGFTDDWEQRKLGEVARIIMGQSPEGNTYSETASDFILVQGNADMQNGWVIPRVWTSQVTKKAAAGDLIMSVRAPAGSMGKTAFNVVIGRGVAAIKGNEFLYQLLVNLDSNGYWKTISTGSTFESLSSGDIINALIKIPKIEEQSKIGEFFYKLDNLITLHQRKLEKLQNIKKAYLNEMFI